MENNRNIVSMRLASIRQSRDKIEYNLIFYPNVGSVYSSAKCSRTNFNGKQIFIQLFREQIVLEALLYLASGVYCAEREIRKKSEKNSRTIGKPLTE